MKFHIYITIAFFSLLLLPALSAKKAEAPEQELNLETVKYIEQPIKIELGFDTAEYLPEDFNPYQGKITIESINYIEDDQIDLGFDTEPYLPKGFNPYK